MIDSLRRWLRRRLIQPYAANVVLNTGGDYSEQTFAEIEIAPDDPLMRFFQERPEVAELSTVELNSPGLDALREAGIKIVAPLVFRGEVVGLLQLGERMSTQDYSPDDFRLLNSLVAQAAPAFRVAQLAEQQKAEALNAERIQQELRVAGLIQHTLLPREVPSLPGWAVAAFYRPARAVGGDFYDFIAYPDGRVGFVIGDVTDKGMPAALLMATTRATLRTMAQRLEQPGEVLRRTNNAICPDVPPSMFVTCLYAILDPASGHLTYANAGHNLPYRHIGAQVSELRATGMPLGLLPDMPYEVYETDLLPGERLLLYSDGLVEAHNPQRDMFGNPRLEELLTGRDDTSGALIARLIGALEQFSGPDWEQEDDITLVVLSRDDEKGTSDDDQPG